MGTVHSIHKATLAASLSCTAAVMFPLSHVVNHNYDIPSRDNTPVLAAVDIPLLEVYGVLSILKLTSLLPAPATGRPCF